MGLIVNPRSVVSGLAHRAGKPRVVVPTVGAASSMELGLRVLSP